MVLNNSDLYSTSLNVVIIYFMYYVLILLCILKKIPNKKIRWSYLRVYLIINYQSTSFKLLELD